MKIKVYEPRIIRIAYQPECGDESYTACTWAAFDIDPENGILNITSDCGNYSHVWPEAGFAFWRLLATMDKGYLLHKLIPEDQEEFDLEATKEELDDWLRESDDISAKRRKRLLEELDDIFEEYSTDSAALASYLVEKWNDDNELEIDCCYEYVQTDYNAQQKRIADIFMKHIQPEIKKIYQQILDRGMDGEGGKEA